jgi:hypothetical protein
MHLGSLKVRSPKNLHCLLKRRGLGSIVGVFNHPQPSTCCPRHSEQIASTSRSLAVLGSSRCHCHWDSRLRKLGGLARGSPVTVTYDLWTRSVFESWPVPWTCTQFARIHSIGFLNLRARGKASQDRMRSRLFRMSFTERCPKRCQPYATLFSECFILKLAH